MTTPLGEAIRNILAGPHGETFKALLKKYSAEWAPLYRDTLAQLEAAPDDAARREILTALAEKVKQWLDAPVDAIPQGESK